jgi:hypothetical protein
VIARCLRASRAYQVREVTSHPKLRVTCGAFFRVGIGGLQALRLTASLRFCKRPAVVVRAPASLKSTAVSRAYLVCVSRVVHNIRVHNRFLSLRRREVGTRHGDLDLNLTAVVMRHPGVVQT